MISIPYLLADDVIWACRDTIHTVYVYVEVAKSRKDLKKKRLSLVPPRALHSITASTIDFIGKQLQYIKRSGRETRGSLRERICYGDKR
jgi:hypothetical protein